MPKKQKRGYLLALLINIDNEETQIWDVYSELLKLFKIINKNSNDYTYYEKLINIIRQKIKTGVNSIIILQKQKQDTAKKILEHINKHHKWLITGNNRLFINSLEISLKENENIEGLIKNKEFNKILEEIIELETKELSYKLEEAINENKIYYSIIEISQIIKETNIQGYILISEEFDIENRNNSKYRSLIQISKNKGVKNKIIKLNSILSSRIIDLGGIVFIKIS